MRAQDGKNLGILTIEDGGRARDRLTRAERDVALAMREIVYAMAGKSKRMRHVAGGVTHPERMLLRLFKDAKRARRDHINYPLCDRMLEEMRLYLRALFSAQARAVGDDRYNIQRRRDVNRLLKQAGVTVNPSITTTGDHPRAA